MHNHIYAILKALKSSCMQKK